MLLNPKAESVIVDNKEYAITWQDYGEFIRLNVFQNDKRIGFRDLPLLVDTDFKMVQYCIRRMVGYGSVQVKTT